MAVAGVGFVYSVRSESVRTVICGCGVVLLLYPAGSGSKQEPGWGAIAAIWVNVVKTELQKATANSVRE
jgi:hypothetical protein